MSHGSYWINEGQAGQFVGWAAGGPAPAPDLPFKILRQDM